MTALAPPLADDPTPPCPDCGWPTTYGPAGQATYRCDRCGGHGTFCTRTLHATSWPGRRTGDPTCYIHRMQAPDPGRDLHDHPWSFVSIVLWGGYTEQRTVAHQATFLARLAERYPHCRPGTEVHRRWLSARALRLHECHRIVALDRPNVWTLVLRGPRRRRWGFYTPDGFLEERAYDTTVRAHRRDLWNEDPATGLPDSNWKEAPC